MFWERVAVACASATERKVGTAPGIAKALIGASFDTENADPVLRRPIAAPPASSKTAAAACIQPRGTTEERPKPRPVSMMPSCLRHGASVLQLDSGVPSVNPLFAISDNAS